MSIAAISSSFVSALRGRPSIAAADPVGPPQRAATAQYDAGRRHELIDAMNQVLAIEGEQVPSHEQAVFRFAQALMHDLRSVDGTRAGQSPRHDADQGPGQAWGRREWNDLPQRIDALATAAGAPVTPAAPVTPVVSAEVPAREVPPQPTPVTTTSAALHLMQVPSSHLLEAYVALRKALGEQANAPASTTPRAGLAAFLQRLSQGLAADAPAALPTGSVLNLTA